MSPENSQINRFVNRTIPIFPELPPITLHCVQCFLMGIFYQSPGRLSAFTEEWNTAECFSTEIPLTILEVFHIHVEDTSAPSFNNSSIPMIFIFPPIPSPVPHAELLFNQYRVRRWTGNSAHMLPPLCQSLHAHETSPEFSMVQIPVPVWRSTNPLLQPKGWLCLTSP